MADPTPEELAELERQKAADEAAAKAADEAKQLAKAKKATQKDVDSVKQDTHIDKDTGTITTVFG